MNKKELELIEELISVYIILDKLGHRSESYSERNSLENKLIDIRDSLIGDSE